MKSRSSQRLESQDLFAQLISFVPFASAMRIHGVVGCHSPERAPTESSLNNGLPRASGASANCPRNLNLRHNCQHTGSVRRQSMVVLTQSATFRLVDTIPAHSASATRDQATRQPCPKKLLQDQLQKHARSARKSQGEVPTLAQIVDPQSPQRR